MAVAQVISVSPGNADNRLFTDGIVLGFFFFFFIAQVIIGNILSGAAQISNPGSFRIVTDINGVFQVYIDTR